MQNTFTANTLFTLFLLAATFSAFANSGSFNITSDSDDQSSSVNKSAINGLNAEGDEQRGKKHTFPTHAYFHNVKQRVFSDPYPFLPQYTVSKKFFDKGGENVLLKHAKRTLVDNSDFVTLETPHKLLQANGICFAGTWQINSESPYSGLYQESTYLPVIVRASVSLSGTKQDDKRAFGIAVKVFPHLPQTGISNSKESSNANNADALTKTETEAKTQNLFLMHSLGGTTTPHLLPLPLTNEPALGSLPPFSQLLTAYRLESDLTKADEVVSGKNANARFRPVAHLANILATPTDNSATVPESKVVAPHWLKVSIASDTPLINKDDFRDELSLKHYPQQAFQWHIDAAPFNKKGIDHANWQRIGKITVNESVTSLTCDTKLHFAHPAVAIANANY